MAVGPAEAEGAHPGRGRVRALGPGLGARLDLEAERLEGDVRARRAEVQAGRQPPSGERQCRLDEPRRTRGSLQMADVGLHRPDPQPPLGRTAATEDGPERTGLDGVTQRGAGAVRLHIVDGFARQPCGCQGILQHGALGVGVGCGEAVAGAVVVDRTAQDDRPHAVAVGAGASQGLQCHEGTALAADVAVGSRIERLAATVRRHGAELGHGDRALGREQQMHAAGQRQLALARAQAGAGEVHGHERGGAGGVDGQARAFKAQGVGNPSADDARVLAGGRVLGDALALGQEPRIVAPHGTQEHADAAALQPGGPDRRVLERLPGELQGQPLLRVHLGRLARARLEEARVEEVHGIQEPAPARAHAAGTLRVGVEQPAHRPAVGRHLADRVDPLDEQAPERLGVVGTRQPAGEAYDGDRIAGVHGQPRRPCAARCLPLQEAFEPLQGRVVPQHGGRQGAVQHRGEPRHEPGGPGRIEAVAVEALARVDRRRVEAQKLAELGAQSILESPAFVHGRRRAGTVSQRGPSRGGSRRWPVPVPGAAR